MRTMKRLLNDYQFNSDMQYYEMIVDSIINGQRTQAKEQFKAMPNEDKQRFVSAIFSYWDSGLSESDKLLFVTPIK